MRQWIKKNWWIPFSIILSAYSIITKGAVSFVNTMALVIVVYAMTTAAIFIIFRMARHFTKG